MKKFSLLLLAAFALALGFSSCDDSDGDYPSYTYFATVHPLEGNDYFFTIDKGDRLYPGDKTRIGAYQAKEGQRAIIYFNTNKKEVGAYDYNISIYGIRNILTKEHKVINTAEELAKVGDDQAEISMARIAGGHLTLQFALATWSGSSHELNLIVNNVTAPDKILEDYVNLEFRQKNSSPMPQYCSFNFDNYVSFPLGDLDPAISGKKGFYIRTRNMHNLIEYIKVEAKSNPEPQGL